MSARLVKRPRCGDIINEGRHGIAVVLAVRDEGRRLAIRDVIGREHDVERATKGHWTRVALPIWRAVTINVAGGEAGVRPFCPACVRRSDPAAMEVTASGVLTCQRYGYRHYREDIDQVRQAAELTP